MNKSDLKAFKEIACILLSFAATLWILFHLPNVLLKDTILPACDINSSLEAGEQVTYRGRQYEVQAVEESVGYNQIYVDISLIRDLD